MRTSSCSWRRFCISICCSSASSRHACRVASASAPSELPAAAVAAPTPPLRVRRAALLRRPVARTLAATAASSCHTSPQAHRAMHVNSTPRYNRLNPGSADRHGLEVRTFRISNEISRREVGYAHPFRFIGGGVHAGATAAAGAALGAAAGGRNPELLLLLGRQPHVQSVLLQVALHLHTPQTSFSSVTDTAAKPCHGPKSRQECRFHCALTSFNSSP